MMTISHRVFVLHASGVFPSYCCSSVSSSDMCHPFVEMCQRTGCSPPPPSSLPPSSLCLCVYFLPDAGFSCINKTTLKMKVQTLSDISSLTSCSLFGSLSTNHRAGPQEVTICRHHGDEARGWRLQLMCYLVQMKYRSGR